MILFPYITLLHCDEKNSPVRQSCVTRQILKFCVIKTLVSPVSVTGAVVLILR